MSDLGEGIAQFVSFRCCLPGRLEQLPGDGRAAERLDVAAWANVSTGVVIHGDLAVFDAAGRRSSQVRHGLERGVARGDSIELDLDPTVEPAAAFGAVVGGVVPDRLP